MQTLPQLYETLSVTIETLGIYGEGIARYNGYTLFIEGALPGEEVSIKLIERKKTYGRGKLLQILNASPSRAKPPCRFFDRCGGCQLMHLHSDAQLKIKQQRVIDALERIGKLNHLNVLPCISSPKPLNYRNKIQVPIRQNENGIEIGFYKRNSHDLVVINQCLVHCTLGEEVFEIITPLIKTSGIKGFNPQSNSGVFRHLIIKTAVHTRQVLVTLVTNGKGPKELIPLAEKILQSHPAIQGVIQSIHSSKGNRVLGSYSHPLAGLETITEKLCGCTFSISAESFFQVNPFQAESLYQRVLEQAALTGKESVLDAYCGVGTLSLILAQKARKVIGIENVPEAIADAKKNGERNHIENVSFLCAESEKAIQTLSHPINVAVVNPPRKGCDPTFIAALIDLLPSRIVYVSCDPATLARDLRLLVDSGYTIKEVQPFDMFPQTTHVETVVTLTQTTQQT